MTPDQPKTETPAAVSSTPLVRRLEGIANECCDLKWELIRTNDLTVALAVQRTETEALCALLELQRASPNAAPEPRGK